MSTPARVARRALLDAGAGRLWEVAVPDGVVTLWTGPRRTAVVQSHRDGGVDVYLVHPGSPLAPLEEMLGDLVEALGLEPPG